MKDNKIIKKLYIVLFVLVFILPAPLYYAMKRYIDTHNYENRIIPQFPALTAENYGSYPAEVENYLKDMLPFKNQMAKVNGIIDYRVFKDTLSHDVVIGKEGWLFYTGKQDIVEDPISDYTGINLFTGEELDTIADNLKKADELMQQRGGRFILVLSPSKMSIYSDMLPTRYGNGAGYKRIEQLYDYLSHNTDICIVNAYEEIKEYRASHLEQIVFLKYDTHENYAGSYISAWAILNTLGYESLPDISTLTLKENEEPEADLANILGIKSSVHDPNNLIAGGYEKHENEFWMNETETELRYTNPAGDAEHGKLMMISDSFGEGMLTFLADYHNESYMVYPRTFKGEMIDKEAPDVLIYQVTERLLENLLKFDINK